MSELMPCGHPRSAYVSAESGGYLCPGCELDRLDQLSFLVIPALDRLEAYFTDDAGGIGA